MGAISHTTTLLVALAIGFMICFAVFYWLLIDVLEHIKQCNQSACNPGNVANCKPIESCRLPTPALPDSITHPLHSINNRDEAKPPPICNDRECIAFFCKAFLYNPSDETLRHAYRLWRNHVAANKPLLTDHETMVDLVPAPKQTLSPPPPPPPRPDAMERMC